MFTICKYNCHYFTLCLPYAILHHILLDICKYLMMQSSLWQMMRTRTSEDSILDIPEAPPDVGVAKPHMEMLHLAHQSAWNNYWQHRMAS
jgi:hypothetical protein